MTSARSSTGADLGVEMVAGVHRQALGAWQEAPHLARGHEDLGGDQARAEPLGLLRPEALGGEPPALAIEHDRLAGARHLDGEREAPRGVEVGEVDEQVAAGVLAVGIAVGAELGGPDDARPRQPGRRREIARPCVPVAPVLVLPHAARVVEVRGREELEVGRKTKSLPGDAIDPLRRLERLIGLLEREQEGAERRAVLDPHDQVEQDAVDAFAAREVVERHRLVAALAEPRRALLLGQRPAVTALVGDVEPTVVVEAQVLARRQQEVGGAHGAERHAAAVRVQADAAGEEPSAQRAAEVGRICAQREPTLGETLVDRAQPRARADDHHLIGGVDLDRVEAREVEREPAILRHRAAHRGRGRAAQRHRHLLVARPAQRRRRLGGVRRLEDDVGDRVRQLPGEQPPEVDVLVAIGLGAQQRVGDDPRGETLGDALPTRLGRRLHGTRERLVE